MGPNAKELFRLVEDFVGVIGFRMKDLRDAYQVTDNLGEPLPAPLTPRPSP